jgi:hypothetical protein
MEVSGLDRPIRIAGDETNANHIADLGIAAFGGIGIVAIGFGRSGLGDRVWVASLPALAHHEEP